MFGFDSFAGHSVADDVESYTIDKLIDFDGFEKYGPPGANFYWYNFSANFLLSAQNLDPMPSQSFFEEWLSISWGGNSPQCGLITGLNGVGAAFGIIPGFGNSLFVSRTMPANYSRVIVGYAFMSNLNSTAQGLFICDGSPGQVFIGVDNGGRVIFNGSANLFTSGVKVQQNTRHYLEVDVTIHNTAGAYKVWLDGVLLGSATGVNTRAGTSNNYCNRLVMTNGTTGLWAFDDMYWRDNTTGTALPFGDVSIVGLPVTSDSSVQFTPVATLGQWYTQQTPNTATPGANILILVPVTPATNMTVNSIGTLPRTTTTAAKFKGVIYSDSSGAPGSLLSSGTEVIGCTSGTNLSLPLASPQALTGGTQYWIGLITDTSIAYQLSDTWSASGQSKANTYTSGAPAGPLSGMSTLQSPWALWGICTSPASNYPGINKQMPPQSASVMLSSNSSSTVGQEDLYNTQRLSTIPSAIYSVKVSANVQKTTNAAAQRFFSIRLKNNTADSGGSNLNNLNIAPSTTPGWYSSRFDTDPNTNASWIFGGGDQWSSTFAPTKFAITNAGLTATATAHNQTDTIIGTTSHSTGKWYFELQYVNIGGADFYLGLAKSTIASNTVLGLTVGSGIAWHSSNRWAFGGFSGAVLASQTNNDWMGFAVDLTNGKIWIRNATAAPSSWFGASAGDPVAGTNGFDISSITGSNVLFLLSYCSNQNGIDEASTMNVGASAFAATAPAGYTAWNSSPVLGLNTMTVGYKLVV
jgi:hypothetical protein